MSRETIKPLPKAVEAEAAIVRLIFRLCMEGKTSSAIARYLMGLGIPSPEGEIPQFYAEGSHPAIIEPDEFDAVQAELERRNELGRPMGRGSPFSAKVVCGDLMAGMARRSGVVPASTGRPSGSATTSTRATTNTARPTLPRPA